MAELEEGGKRMTAVEEAPGKRKGKTNKVWTVLGHIIPYVVIAAASLIIGAGIMIKEMSVSITQKKEDAFLSVLSVKSEVERADTLPKRSALEAKMIRMMKEGAVSDLAIVHYVFMAEIIYQPENGMTAESSIWEKRDQLARHSLRNLEGQDLEMYMDYLGDSIFVERHEELQKLNEANGFDFTVPMVNLSDREQVAVKECFDVLEEHFQTGGWTGQTYKYLDVINPKLATPDCQLNQKLDRAI